MRPKMGISVSPDARSVHLGEASRLDHPRRSTAHAGPPAAALVTEREAQVIRHSWSRRLSVVALSRHGRG